MTTITKLTMAPQIPPNYAKLLYQYLINHFFFFISPIFISLSIQSFHPILKLYNSIEFNSLNVISSFFIIITVVAFFILSKPRTVYLVDYALYKPPQSWKLSSKTFVEHAKQVLPTEPVNFLTKILERSGLGEETCFPPAMQLIPPNPNMQSAREEAEVIIFSCMDSLFKKTKLKPKDIDILVINCSVFSPTPSLTAMVINKYRMRSNIKSFNLSGMGCSAGLLSIDLAKDLLKCNPNSNAVVLSTEILSTRNFYKGKERAMLLPNAIFRVGGAAVLLSNLRSDRHRAKYRLVHLIRTHKGSDDKSFNCIQQEQDGEGHLGIRLNKDLMVVAGDALKSNITTLGPLVLPISEKILFVLSLVWRKFLKFDSKPYVPDFATAFEHFCIHAGGRAVIDELQKNLRLTAEHVEASRMTLHRFGNTSSSSIWYELSYIECKGRMKKGDRVWQIGIGSGFKCNSAVWKCNRTVKKPLDGAWVDCIESYPVHIPDVVKI
ncbi:hypothetical protein BUALT_Bualt05G0128400 [Buddleja alternifolia]|uniref:3-ketoacyl-CoA synthase n=1 Tax=Buddleja alternifolia TaxID=168488 RepID=A0AAV6XQP6_9LAMI|nr:hypothetical protein BUALT_Bualt05G0128400 [Buddleja alternifolia]